MSKDHLCVVCGGPIPASRGTRATTCCPEHSAKKEKTLPQLRPDQRLYEYPVSEYDRAIQRLGWSQVGAAKMLGIDPRTSRRYISGDLQPPKPLQLLLRVLVNLKRTEEWFLEVTAKEID